MNTRPALSLPPIRYHLRTNPEDFGLVEREKGPNGKPVLNRCGRDFLCYALYHLKPDVFTAAKLPPFKIEREHLFGIPMPAPLVWTGLPFMHVPSLLATYNLSLEINGIEITSHWNFMQAMWSKPLPYRQALNHINVSIDENYAVGIDLPIGAGGLLDHVMFVYGFDARNFYVFDTRQIAGLEYEKLTPPDDNRFIMKLPFTTMQRRWKRHGRIWVVKRSPPAD